MLRHLVLSAALILAAAVPAMAQCNTRFRVVNNTPVMMSMFNLRVTGTSDWGPDRFGEDVLAPGASYDLDTRAPGRHDVRIVAVDGRGMVITDVDICVTRRVIATPQGLRVE